MPFVQITDESDDCAYVLGTNFTTVRAHKSVTVVGVVAGEHNRHKAEFSKQYLFR